MRKGTAVTLTVGLVTLIGALLVGQTVLPSWGRSVRAMYPEAQQIVTPAVVWGIVVLACLEAVAVIALCLVASARAGRTATGSARAALVLLATVLVQVVVGLIGLSWLGFAQPGVMLGLIVIGLLCAVGIAVPLGRRSALTS